MCDTNARSSQAVEKYLNYCFKVLSVFAPKKAFKYLLLFANLIGSLICIQKNIQKVSKKYYKKYLNYSLIFCHFFTLKNVFIYSLLFASLTGRLVGSLIGIWKVFKYSLLIARLIGRLIGSLNWGLINSDWLRSIWNTFCNLVRQLFCSVIKQLPHEVV